MSFTIFLALCILGMDCLIYFLFQWTYGEKRCVLARKIAAHRDVLNLPSTRPCLVSSNTPAAQAPTSCSVEPSTPAAFRQRLA